MAYSIDMLPTGVPHLDTVLGGGIVRTSTVLIVGASGTGKTVLGSQIVAAAAQRGEPVVLVTAFGESHNKRIANLERFSFFNRSDVGARIRLINMEHQLHTSLDDAANTIVREARDHHARLVLVDSLHSVRMCGGTPNAAYHFLHDLGAKLHLLGVTTLLLDEGNMRLPVLVAESMLADTVIELQLDAAGARIRRTLQVTKHQSMPSLLGPHTFTIGDAGVHCYGRFELMPQPAAVVPTTERVSTGLPHLDQMLGGGVPRGSTTLITGATGTGKTTLALQGGLQRAAQGESTLFVTLGAPAQHVLAHGPACGIDPDTLHPHLQIEEHALATLDPDIVAHHLRAHIADHPGGHVVIDGAQYLVDVLGGQRAPGFWASLFAHMRAHHVTTWILYDDEWTHERTLGGGASLRTLADNLVDLYRTGTTPCEYLLDVVKMRGSDHARASQPYSIGAHGLRSQQADRAVSQG